MRSNHVLAGLLAVSSLCAVRPALASGSVALEEVVITAQRRSSQLQTTAAAVSAYTAEDLVDQSMSDIEDLGQFNPSMDVALYQGEAQVYIRGIGYSGIIGGTDSSTALHIDGVYLSRSSAAVPGFFDMDRVEVVRGPQGTLYGRNATSGSVNIIRKRPTQEFSLEAGLTVGNYDLYRTFGAVSGGLTDKLRGRIAVQLEDHRGYTTLNRPGDDPLNLSGIKGEAEAKDDITTRFVLEYDATENLLLSLSGDYYQADDSQSVWLYLGRGTGTNPFMRAYVEARGGILPETYSRRLGSDIEHINKPRIWGLTGRAEWNFDNYTLTSITSHRETNPLNRNDLDTTAAFGVDQLREEDHTQFSQEFQLSSPQGHTLEWIVGLYYFTEENDIRNEYFLPFIDEQFGLPADPDCCLLKLNGSTETDAIAIFGEVNYDLSDQLELVLGARYSEESRDGTNDVVFEGFIPGALDNVSQFDEETFESFTPKVGLNYQATDDVFLYASISEGFKSGGFNAGSYQDTPFDPEEITAYEVGAKMELLDARVRLNTALFYYDYTDLQIQDVESNNTIVRNAANAEISGLEVETTALLTEHTHLDFGFTWLDTEFVDVELIDPKAPGLGVQDLQGNQLPRAPEFKVVLGLQQAFMMRSGELTARLDWSWQDETYFSAFNTDSLSQDAYDWGKFRLSYKPFSGAWSTAIFIDNISDEAVATNATYNGDIIDSTVTGSLAPPRTYGVEFRFSY